MMAAGGRFQRADILIHNAGLVESVPIVRVDSAITGPAYGVDGGGVMA